VVRDGYAVAGNEQADHDLGTVTPVVPGVAKGPGGEAIRGGAGPLEVRRGQVVTDQAQVEVGEVGERGVEVVLGGRLGPGHNVEAPVVLMGLGDGKALGHDHIGAHPVDHLALGARVVEAVGHHGEDGVAHGGGVMRRSGGEVGVQAQATPVGPHRSHRAQRRGAVGLGQFGVHPLAVGMSGQGGHDAVELAALRQRQCLTQAGHHLVAHLGAISEGLHQREIPIGPLAPTNGRRLHVHRP
jgi:hypothetical protein